MNALIRKPTSAPTGPRSSCSAPMTALIATIPATGCVVSHPPLPEGSVIPCHTMPLADDVVVVIATWLRTAPRANHLVACPLHQDARVCVAGWRGGAGHVGATTTRSLPAEPAFWVTGTRRRSTSYWDTQSERGTCCSIVSSTQSFSQSVQAVSNHLAITVIP